MKTNNHLQVLICGILFLLIPSLQCNGGNTFTLKGKVEQGVNAEKYLVYVWDYDKPMQQPEPIDTIDVKDGLFCYSTTLDQPYSGMLQAIATDGSKGEFYIEFLFVPGETCKIDIKGKGFDEFTLSGSKFYKDWESFAQFWQTERQKALSLNGEGDEAYFSALSKYNQKHKGEEGCIMYQYMWLASSIFDFSIADGISQGRFKNYIQHRKSQYGKQ